MTNNEFPVAKEGCEYKSRVGNPSREAPFDPLAFDMEWAESIVDEAALKRVDFKNVSTKNGRGQESLSQASTSRTDTLVKRPPENLSSLVENIQQLSVQLGAEAKTNRYLRHQCDVLQERVDSLETKITENKAHAEAYRGLLKKFEGLKTDSGTNLESLLDVIYTCIHDAFGPDCKLTLAFEELADLHLKREALRDSQIREAQMLNKVIGTDGLGQVLQQKTKIIDSLVEQLRTLKCESLQTNAKLQQQVDELTRQAQEHVERINDLSSKHLNERQRLDSELKTTKTEYKQLLRDQQDLLSQMALVKVKAQEQGTQDLLTTESNHLKSLVEALYNKDASNQALLERKDAVIEQQHHTIQRLENRIRDWESDAVLWLEFVERVKLLKEVAE